uniref:SAM domain-containing protein n=1 Tax=Gallus gallus TaxID=9031 RepID=A0A8V0X3D0_CHICK
MIGIGDCASLPVSSWLAALHLDQYSATFRQHRFRTASDCRTITEADLTRLGVLLPAHRRRILLSLRPHIHLWVLMAPYSPLRSPYPPFGPLRGPYGPISPPWGPHIPLGVLMTPYPPLGVPISPLGVPCSPLGVLMAP